MNENEKIKSVYEKLMTVQTKLKAPKDQKNTFGNYNYRNCEDILEAVKPHLKEVNATLVLSDDLVLIGERYYIKATARFIDCESGDYTQNTAYAREEEVKKGMDGSQITGSSSSYARKYALNGLLCIDDTKDSDTTNNELASKEQIAKIEELGVIKANVLARYKVKNLAELTYSQAEEVIKIKTDTLEKAKKQQETANETTNEVAQVVAENLEKQGK